MRRPIISIALTGLLAHLLLVPASEARENILRKNTRPESLHVLAMGNSIPNICVDARNTSGTETGTAQHPYNTIQEAVNAASAVGTTVIGVATSTYTEKVLIEDKTVHLLGGYAGGSSQNYQEGTGGDFSTRDPVAYVSHVQGDSTDAVITMINAGGGTLDGFRITGGGGSGVYLPWFYAGGGVHVRDGSPTIANNTIENNDTRHGGTSAGVESLGGGIYAESSNVSILNNVIRDNYSGYGAGVHIDGGAVIITGNTVEGNVGVSDHGGGLHIGDAIATVSHNVILENEIGRDLGYGQGGGIIVYGEGTDATLSHNIVRHNYAPSYGAGVFVDDGAAADLDHELVFANQCDVEGSAGAGIYVDGYSNGGEPPLWSTASITNTTVADNSCGVDSSGCGLAVDPYSNVAVANSIFFGHNGDDFIVAPVSTLTVTYTLSQEAISGTGNITGDPLFANPAGHDYHLKSTTGRWDPTASGGSGAWVTDFSQSPAIDAGNPASAYIFEPQPNGGRVNMGAYGNTTQASKSLAFSGVCLTSIYQLLLLGD